MKISRIEFENFRNFKERGIIDFDTTGKLNLIYGKNGEGKTTLHQFFQWIFYGNVKFNRTTNDGILYNHEFEDERQYNDHFDVYGSIDFENNGEMFSAIRKWTYVKELKDSKISKKEFTILKKDKDNDWKRLNEPSLIIEELLPSGLSEYFFFDGESMIADLSIKGKDSANSLKKALYTIFELNSIERAISHIGSINSKTTALGKLYLEKKSEKDEDDAELMRINIEKIQTLITTTKKKLMQHTEDIKKYDETIKKKSEEIGGNKSHADYENSRNEEISNRDVFLQNCTSNMSKFGEFIIDRYPKILISKSVEEAKKILKLKIDESQLIPGLQKRLLDALKNETHCICGNKIEEKEIECFNHLLNLMPPNSYKSCYDDLCKEAKENYDKYDINELGDIIKSYLSNYDRAVKCDEAIDALDKNEKKSQDVEALITSRNDAEIKKKEIEQEKVDTNKQLIKYELVLKKFNKDFDEITSACKLNVKIMKKAEILTKINERFEQQLQYLAEDYSNKLEIEIQTLLNKMLTTKRTVKVSRDFSVQIIDSYYDESKSEGQFATVSFAYIGGILKLLKSEVDIIQKEYPLVLDGPFSKLDKEQRQKVIETLPEFASQVIIFSKDNLQTYIDDSEIGRVWTMNSNEEKNVARVEEGYLWNN